MAERRFGASAATAVLVEVGSGFGALVVSAPAGLCGAEIEISPVEAPERRQHVLVLPRALPRGTAFAAVFPSLRSGDYLLWNPQGDPLFTVAIPEAGVQEVSWPTPVPWPSAVVRHQLTSTEGD